MKKVSNKTPKRAKKVSNKTLTADQMHHLRVEMMCEDITAIIDQYSWHTVDKKLLEFAGKIKDAALDMGRRAEKLAGVEVEG